MRHTTTGLAVLAAAALLAGCSSSGHPHHTASTTAATVQAAPTMPVRDRFLSAINAANIQSWEHNGPSDDELAAYPDQWCGALAQGHSVQWMFSKDGGMYPIGDTWGTQEADADQVLLIAVRYYCPTRKAEVEKELRAAGNY